jgi:hypothetical protein
MEQFQCQRHELHVWDRSFLQYAYFGSWVTFNVTFNVTHMVYIFCEAVAFDQVIGS